MEAQMDSWPSRRRAPRGPLHPPGLRPAPRLLALLLLAWPPRLAAGQSVAQSGPPIMVSLANTAVSFTCTITYLNTPEYTAFSVTYMHEDREGRQSEEEPVPCPPGSGTENKTHTVVCRITPKLPSASATGTYYCLVRWGPTLKLGEGTFILVRDTGYQEPPPGPRKLLLFFFLGLLLLLSLLGTALLVWKKAQTAGKLLAWTWPVASPAKEPQQPPPNLGCDSVYTALQRRETEVYSCIQSQAGSPPSSQGLHSQEKPRSEEEDSEFNLIYENF